MADDAQERETIPSQQSEAELLGLRPVATAESSKEIKTWPERIKEQALFSARTTSRAYLDLVRKRLVDVAARLVIPSVAESSLRRALQDIGYSPNTGFPDANGQVPSATPGSIRDLSSSRRIQLIIDTNVKQARSMGQIASSENPVFLMTNPAWRLTRTGARKKPRGDWQARWEAAGNAVGWQGASRTQYVALKTSPIWSAIGSGAGGFDDTLESSFPPFAFGSGMAWVNVGRREWQRIAKAEGIDDGLALLAEQAKSAKAAHEALYGVGCFGANIPLFEAKKGDTSRFRRLIGGDTVVRTAFNPNIRSKQRALEQIDGTTADASAAAAAIRQARARLRKAQAVVASMDLDNAEEVAGGIAKYDKVLAAREKDITALASKMAAYRRKTASVAQPTNDKQQFVFDTQMNRVEEAAIKTRGQIADVREIVESRVSEWERMAEGDV